MLVLFLLLFNFVHSSVFAWAWAWASACFPFFLGNLKWDGECELGICELAMWVAGLELGGEEWGKGVRGLVVPCRRERGCVSCRSYWVDCFGCEDVSGL